MSEVGGVHRRGVPRQPRARRLGRRAAPGSREKELWGGELATTNNRMELTAAIEALKLAEASRAESSCIPIPLTSAAESPSGCATWRARDWRTADRKPVKNQDLWQALSALADRHEVEWHWVRGHSGHPENERADALANRGLDETLATGVAKNIPTRPGAR